MKKKYKIALIAIAILIAGVTYIGATYSLWVKTFESKETNTIKSGCFTIGFEEKTKSISLKNTYPVSDTKALGEVKPYQIKVTNTCDTTDAGFSLTLNTVSVTGTKLDDAKVKFAVGENGVKPTTGKILKTAEVNTEVENIQVSGTLITSYIINTGYIEKGTSKTFEVYLWVDEAAGNETQNQKFQAGVMVTTYSTTIQPLLSDIVKKNIVTTGSGVYEVKHDDAIIGSHMNATQTNNLKQTEYRYAGQNPNNYILFNNELWRIIGLVNTPEGSRVKLILQNRIGTYPWDSSESSINSGYGVNEWSQADLMKLLNPGFESETVGGSLYWNKSSGDCYKSAGNVIGECDFTNTGMNEEAKLKIDTITWNTGTNGTNNYNIADNGLAKHFYNYEKSNNNGKICASGADCSDTVARTTTWQGKVGLMSTSDYGYATSGGSVTNRESCLNNKGLYNWNGSDVSDCKNNDWIFDTSFQWFLNPVASSYTSMYAFGLANGGNVVESPAMNSDSVRPSVYLTSKTSVSGGEGTESNPYTLN